MKRPSPALLLLMLALFLTPIIGGQLAIEVFPVEPGLGNWIRGAFGGSELPTTAHALLATLICGAFILALVERPVVSVAKVQVGLTIALFLVILGGSLVSSKFPLVSLLAWLEWVCYGLATYAVIACAGRTGGPLALVSAFSAGTILLALKGWAEMVSNWSDPSWRIFADWNNPNALAGMLVLGFILTLGLMVQASGKLRFIWLSGATALGGAIVFSGSKGALLALAVGLVALVVLLAKPVGKRLGWVAVVIGVTVAIVAGVTALRSHPGDSGGLRIAQAAQQQEQSAGFRQLLWKGAIRLIQAEPQGVGIGAYRYNSTRSGLHTYTVFTHNSYLQLATEASPVALLAFLVLGFLWLKETGSGYRGLPPPKQALLGAVIAAVLALGAHSLVDSDLYYFGIGLSFFALLGVGLQLANDGSSTEYLPAGLRFGGAACLVGIVSALGFFSYVEHEKAVFSFALRARDVDLLQVGDQSLGSLAPNDGQALFLRSSFTQDPVQRIDLLKAACQSMPSLRNLRVLGQQMAALKQYESAKLYYSQALKYDPNNLATLIDLTRLHIELKEWSDVRKVANRTVAVEGTSYFKIRSIAELVPTETYEARLLMAFNAKELGLGREEVERLLADAIAGFVEYAKLTLPRVKMFAQTPERLSFAGESIDEAKEKMALARKAAEELADIYRATGAPDKADAVVEVARTFVVD